MAIVIVGAGVAGLGAGLALARDGHEVIVLERDGVPDDGSWTSELDATRPGCPQLNQGHSFLARAWMLLERNAPDVLDAMLAAGGNPTDGNLVLPPDHHDDTLRAMAIRRSVIDRTLLATVRSEPRITLESGTVTELVTGPARDGIPTVTGVRTGDGRRFDADLVVDASGRRSGFPEMVQATGARAPDERTSPCGLVYYGMFCEIRPEAAVPPMFVPLAVRASLGYMGFAVFWQDARIIILGLAVETADRELRALRSDAAFLAACRAIKPMAAFAGDAFATQRSGVVSMGGLHNIRRSYVTEGMPRARGFVAIGDALCHTDPTPAYGMSMALEQAFLLPALVRSHAESAAVPLEEAVGPELDDRFDQVAQANAERMEIAAGRRPHLETDREWVIETGAPLLAREDPDLLRRYLRRVLAVDRPSVLAADADFMSAARAAIVDAGLLDKTRKPARDQLLAIIADADQTSVSSSSR